ncbi:hypothetical protein GPECTOR_3g329 [Gonium pectorale]|uniref:Serine aminopeptidase S33 domain-containing protein n=1 Tax=Gonium pectorale TaxID=33097 RepID=A0A150GZJ8_GONPE|nr:hypothetical protein GPECTOR_3g329 [Gonium pectorale]|eukprot:KXZ55183.1 hypothetical protein GPECTOR_3g329 [Gonium pectorale]
MGKSKGEFTNKRGQKLVTYAFVPDDVASIKAVLFWHHGLGGSKVWADAGIAVYGFDAHGMGLSEPLAKGGRCYIKRFSHLLDDALLFISHVLLPDLKDKGVTAPLFMGGGSLGGLMAAYVVLEQQQQFKGLIMLAPALDVEWTPLLRVQAAVGNLVAALLPRVKLVPAVRPEDMSQDPAVVKAFLEDPLMYKDNVRARTANEILRAFRALIARRKDFTLPTLGIHGTSDRCTSLPALRAHLKAVSSTDVTLKEVEGGYHDLLHGPEKDEVNALVRDWILERAAAAAKAT